MNRRLHPMLVLLRLVRFSPRYFLLTVLFATLVFLWLPIPLGLASRAFFDALSGSAPAGVNAWSAIALIVAVQVGDLFVSPLLGVPWNALQEKSRVLLQRNLFAAILRGYGRHGLPVSRGEAISRFRDDPNAMADGLDALCDLIGRTFFAIAAVVVMWSINPPMTVVLVVPLALSAWVTEVLGTRTLAYRAAAQAATSRVTGFLGELVGAQLAVKVAGAAPNVVRRLRELGDERRRMAVRDGVFDVLTDSFSVNLGHFGSGVVLLLGAQAVANGSFTVGDFALFVMYLDQLVWYPAEIARIISDLKRVDVSYRRICDVVPGAPAGALVKPAPLYLSANTRAFVRPVPVERERLECLEVHNLSYAYDNGACGIADISFALPRGSFTVVTGRIGAGKSTLLQVLLGLLPRDSGEICWNDRVVDDPSTFFVPPRSAYTPQVPRLFSDTLHENLLLGRDVSRGAIQRAVHAAVLEPDLADLENGLDTFIGPRGVKLSGGQVQRTAAARMFLADAELFVLDDVSSAVDAQTEAELWRRLFARGDDATCLVVSHRPAALRRADRVLVMASGHIVASGTLDELLLTSEDMQRLWRDEEQSRQPDRQFETVQ